MKKRFIRGGAIGLVALGLSTLGIFASDALQGIDSRAGVGGSSLCPQGMTLFSGSEGQLCIDIYEASVAVACPHPSPRNVFESEKNASTDGCYAASIDKRAPWTYVTLAQAQRLCAASGKRLPTSDEWYTLAFGTTGEECQIEGDAPRESGESGCRSSAGAFDMVGNVWEWTNETVNGNMYRERALPSEGYVHEADASGIAITTESSQGSELYGNDYFWSKSEGVFGMIRGGFYGSGNDAGLYTVNASVPTNFATAGLGFRCVKSM